MVPDCNQLRCLFEMSQQTPTTLRIMKKAIPPILIILGVFLFWMKFNRDPARVIRGVALGNAIPSQLVDSSGKAVLASSLQGKFVGVYFSAHWCPPCRVFTPALVKFRDANVENNFEVLFVSADQSEREKQQYIQETGMKWPSVPGASGPAHRDLEMRFHISGYPTLVILAPDGTVVTSSGRDDILISPSSALAKWKAAADS